MTSDLDVRYCAGELGIHVPDIYLPEPYSVQTLPNHHVLGMSFLPINKRQHYLSDLVHPITMKLKIHSF